MTDRDRETLKRYCEVWDEEGWPTSANFGQSLVDNIRSLLERLEAAERKARDIAEDVWELSAECNLRQMWIDAALALHVQDREEGEDVHGCLGCHEEWPCPTVEALKGEEE